MNRKTAFSLIELLVVIGVIVILAAIALPVIGRTRESSRAVGCIANLKAIAAAVHLYAAEHQNNLPASYLKLENTTASTWTARIGPYLPGSSGAKPTNDAPNVRYCPNTSVYKTGIFKRDLATWRIDYAANSDILLSTISGSTPRRPVKSSEVNGNVVLAFDGRQLGNSKSSTPHHRHSGGLHIVFFDGHAKWAKDLPADPIYWKPRDR